MGCKNSRVSDGGKLEKDKIQKAMKSSIIIQKWFRRYKARLEARRRCTWKIFESIEYNEEQDQLCLYNFFNEMVDHANTGGLASKFKDVLLSGQLSSCNFDEQGNDAIIEEINKTEISSDYNGPHVTLPLSLETTQAIIKHIKQGKVLHAKYVKLLLWETTKRIRILPNVLEANLNISKQITICGDIHGKIDDLLTVFHKNGLPSSDNPYIFNGDFVDRGQSSCEVLIILCCFFLLYPSEVYLNRGNHEDYLMNSRYGFIKEIQNKYKNDAGTIKELCKSLFSWLPLATIVNKRVFVAHGGISDKTDIEKIKLMKRCQFTSVLKPSHISLDEDIPPKLDAIVEWEQILDLLWSDPQAEAGKVFNHTRGGGCFFGPDITATFLQKNGLELIIRSHECKYEGFEYTHNDKVLTVFSASNYYAEGSNYGAYLKLDADAKPFPVQYLVIDGAKFLTLKHKVSVNEQSALRELRERFFYHRDELIDMFKKYDVAGNGTLKVSDWALCMESVLKLKIPWTLLRSRLAASDESGRVLYMSCLEGYEFNSAVPQQLGSISEILYRKRSSLETVFRLIDKDCSGYITLDEFEHSCEVLNRMSSNQIQPNKVNDLAKSLDINKDGLIDFNEFLEAFRLVSLSVKELENVAVHETIN